MIKAMIGPRGPSTPSEIQTARACNHVETTAREITPHATAHTTSRITNSADELDVSTPANTAVGSEFTGRDVRDHDRWRDRPPFGPPA